MPKSAPAPAPKRNLPVHRLRHRSIEAAIWKNETDKGPMYNVTVSRSYREGEKWHESQSFGYDDLLVIAKLMNDAHTYISALKAKERRSKAETLVR